MSDTPCTHHNDQQRTACPVCLVTQLRAELSDLLETIKGGGNVVTFSPTDIGRFETLVAQAGAEDEELRAEAELSDQAARFHDEIVSRQGTVRANQELDLKELNHLRAELAAERARTKQIATALKDAISTYFGDDKLVTAERIEAWQAALKEDVK